ncbi:MAG TPA: hypothetical protein VF494_11170 [Candidatus Limnocylindrales bacterium]
MRSLVVGTILAAVLASCGGPPGTLYQALLTNTDGDYPLPVTLGDTTGVVVGIGAAQFDPADFRDAGVLADPADPKAFTVTWLGGACDNDTALALRTTDSGYDVELRVHEKLGLGCIALGILRGVRVQTSAPIDVGAITISGDRKIELVMDEDCGPLTAAATDDAKIACGALLEATVGDQRDVFARVTVGPEDGACPGTECAVAAGISAQAWRVDATDRTGRAHTWHCTYADEKASCTAVSEPSPS